MSLSPAREDSLSEDVEERNKRGQENEQASERKNRGEIYGGR